jgi:DNA-binding NtrC family response regulator
MLPSPTAGLPRDPIALTKLHTRLRAAGDATTGSALLLEWARDWLRSDTGLVVARGAVHFRSPEGGYRAVHASEWLADDVSPLSPSASVWTRVAESDATVWLDLGTCRGFVVGTGEAFETAPAQVPFERTSSVLQMIERHSTHVLAAPLRGTDRIEGMLTLEVADHAGVLDRIDVTGRAMEVGAALELLGPALLGLPSSRQPRGRPSAWPVVGRRMESVLALVETLAAEDEVLLLEGPSGIGKTHLARLCHERSPRRDGPCVVSRLASLPAEVQRAELVGRAGKDPQPGLLAQAEGGTLVLDGVAGLTPEVQSLLVEIAEGRRYLPVDAVRLLDANVRLVVTTSISLTALHMRGELSDALRHRLHVFPIRVPSLEEREDEVEGWALWFAKRRLEAVGKAAEIELAKDAVMLLTRARWPGQLRQLDNVMRRALAFRKLGPSRRVRVDREQVAAALTLEADPGRHAAAGEGALAALAQAARLIAGEAIEHRGRRGAITLADLDVLRGAVLQAATERLGTTRAAYEALGAESFVTSRNHARDYKRHLEALAHLERKLKR